ncbi:MAG: glucosamine-6-phosphate deaminase [Phycisphaerales bacterium]|nr:glucosamine-6-phosphate deaminase [Phycisphaerales bacterium]
MVEPSGDGTVGENIRTRVFRSSAEAADYAAGQIAQVIRSRQKEAGKCVLGLATGSTPVAVYRRLIHMHRQGELSFKNVVTFNLDEYYPMHPQAAQSYRRFMHEQLFDHVDIQPANIHIPDGSIAPEAVAEFCRRYEEQILAAGGLDIQLLGIGRSGHIGFNEPGSTAESRTRLITLDRITRLDAAGDFFGEEHVPRRAITMGVATILEASKIVLLAFGENKAAIVAQAVEGPAASQLPASYLQRHKNAEVVLDRAGAAELTRSKCPWRFGPVDWNPAAIRKAVIWLARTKQKAILKLTDEHYNEHGLQDLLADKGPAYRINLDVFRDLTPRVTGWPGGKPASAARPGDIRRARDEVFPKRVLVFSPHPDDDVISMGGTLIRLVDQGHEVHVAYQTSGNIAVFDSDAVRFTDFAADFNRLFGLDATAAAQLERQTEEFVRSKKPGEPDQPQLLKVKALIRRGECRAAAREIGMPVERLHFLDLPFYETGVITKNPPGPEDTAIVRALLEKIKPHQIYAAGDLTDPHGTHRVCLDILLTALRELEAEQWRRQCEVWLYRGAWQEWPPETVDMAIPISPQELLRKRSAIFKHQSQKDRAMFPGTDEREFWQRAEARNRGTAELFDTLGLAEYEAIEGFVRWTPTNEDLAL